LIARSLAADGVAVGLLARSGDELAETLALIEASGGRAAAVAADVTYAPAVADAIGELGTALGPVDLLVNNAGVPGPCGPTWDVDPDAWWRAVEVNLLGTFTVTRLALARMVPRRTGRIVNITSQAGVHRWPTVSAYSVAKAAVIKLTENLAHETHRLGISVFGVDPGLLPIGFSEVARAAGDSPNPYEARVSAWIRDQLEHGHGADPARAAELVVRLASGRCDELTGRQLSVHDDLDEIRERIGEVRDRDLYVLALQRLAARPPKEVQRCT
jgi:NAD(P)-dependent dehydrogenase (short-subunit alcohol dehydrogenase family)